MPVITTERETLIYDYIRDVSESLRAHVLVINGISDHVHVALSLHPAVALADWVQRCKGGSSHLVNQQLPYPAPLVWQASYAVFTISQKMLPIAFEYIIHQKSHHATGNIIAAIEPMDDEWPDLWTGKR